jgi:hypothetical protein
MSASERWRLSAGILVLLPAAAWLVVVQHTEPLPPDHKLQALSILVARTPQKPLLLLALAGGLVLALICVWTIARLSQDEFAGAPFRTFLRGTRIVSARQLRRRTGERGLQVSVAGIPIPTGAENLHMLIGGGTGAGKSTLFREIVHGAAARGDRMICLDPNGDMLAKFWQDGDVILNPYDRRTEGWSFFNEIRADYDFHRYALSLVPPGQTPEAEEWAGYGRLLLRETARKLNLLGQPSIRELFRWTTIAPAEELQAFLADTLAESLFVGSAQASKALASARFVLSDKLPEHVTMPPGAFSLRTWLETPDAGNLWITWREDMGPALKPLISAWTDALFVSILSMTPDENRRIWAFIDELASLEKLATLEAALTKGRKYGLRVVAGLQSTSQLDDSYGRAKAQTLRSCFSSLAVLRISKSDPATAEDFSQALGEHEVERERKSSSVGWRNSSDGRQTVHERERVVAPSELTALPDLTGYLALVGDRPIARFRTAWHPFENRHPGFVERTDGRLGG